MVLQTQQHQVPILAQLSMNWFFAKDNLEYCNHIQPSLFHRHTKETFDNTLFSGCVCSKVTTILNLIREQQHLKGCTLLAEDDPLGKYLIDKVKGI
jgi:hypothetical protein